MENIMAKKKKQFLQEIASVEEEVEEIAEKVAMEEPEFLVEEEEDAGESLPENPTGNKMKKQEFLDSIGMGSRPGSQLAATKWEEYCVGI